MTASGVAGRGTGEMVSTGEISMGASGPSESGPAGILPGGQGASDPGDRPGTACGPDSSAPDASGPGVGSEVWMDALRWDDRGLITVVTQEAATLKVLMVAWMNREALELTARTRQATYWSRSRSRLWRKGEESGHTQAVQEIRADCDGDTLLLLVEQKGGIACHTGRHHCFFNRLDPKDDADLDWTVVEPVLEAPAGSSSGSSAS